MFTENNVILLFESVTPTTVGLGIEMWKTKFVIALERLCSQTQLCQLRCINSYTIQLHVSAFTGHLQVVFKRT